MLYILKGITDFADPGLVLPALAVLAAGLALMGWRRGALAWLAAMAGVGAAMLLLKLAFAAAGGIAGVYSPSGHVAMAGVVAGGAWSLSRAARWRTAATLLTAALAATGIGATRLLLGAHSLAEVLVAAPVGVAGAVALVQWAGLPPARLLRFAPASAALVVALAVHGAHLPAERAIAVLLGAGPPIGMDGRSRF